jgi:serine/threonine-protein kinase
LARFNQEANALGRIKSQHVVQIFDRSEMPDGTPFIVMELLDGESLVERLERTGALSPELVAKIIRSLADALTEVHAHGIVHRDMKAENIYLVGAADSPFVKLLDFGVCKLPMADAKAKLTTPGMMVGTPEYMSPTQTVAAMAVDHKADLWSLGVLAYLSLAVQFPFQGERTRDLFAAIRAGQFTPLSQLRPDLAAFDDWFGRAFRSDPKQRFESASEMASAFEQATLARQLVQAGVQQQTDAALGGSQATQTKVLIGALIGAVLLILLLVTFILLRG